MYSEVYAEQKELLAIVEKRLEEVGNVEITNETIANEMIEECDYLLRYLKATDTVSLDISSQCKCITKDFKTLKGFLLDKKKQLKEVKNNV